MRVLRGKKNLLLQFLKVSPSDDDDNEHVGQDTGAAGAGRWVHPFESFQLISRWKKLKVAITLVLYWPDSGGTGQDRRAEILSMRLDWVNWFNADPRQRYCSSSHLGLNTYQRLTFSCWDIWSGTFIFDYQFWFDMNLELGQEEC